MYMRVARMRAPRSLVALEAIGLTVLDAGGIVCHVLGVAASAAATTVAASAAASAILAASAAASAILPLIPLLYRHHLYHQCPTRHPLLLPPPL